MLLGGARTVQMVQKTWNKIGYTSFLIEEGTVRKAVNKTELQMEDDLVYGIEEEGEEEQQDYNSKE
jgi:hypothetical protein